jgi:hypothetical protein
VDSDLGTGQAHDPHGSTPTGGGDSDDAVVEKVAGATEEGVSRRRARS